MTEANQGKPKISQGLIEFDSEFFDITKTINILSAVNPTNFDQQKKTFFDSHFSIEPEFTYDGSKLDVFATKRRLLNLPLENVVDEDLSEIYFDTINSYLDKVDQFNSIGTNDFIYDSLRYFGEPTQKDIGNAKFILHLPGNLNEENEEVLKFEEIKQILVDFAEVNELPYNLKIEENMIANALVSGNTIKLNKNAKLSISDTNALAQHEIGVHLVTTLNARNQPLRILLLKEEYGASNDIAFAVCSRIYRGGGFVKDYLYMQGFHKMLNAYENEPNFDLLFAGKTSIDYLPQITNLIDKGILQKPQYVSTIFKQPESLSEIKQYIAHAIK